MPKAWGFGYVGNKKPKKEPSAMQRAFLYLKFGCDLTIYEPHMQVYGHWISLS